MFPARKKTSAAEPDGAPIATRAPRRWMCFPVPRMFSTLFGLLDRADRSQGLTVPRIESLAELPAALGL